MMCHQPALHCRMARGVAAILANEFDNCPILPGRRSFDAMIRITEPVLFP